jgi:hypothetical protein
LITGEKNDTFGGCFLSDKPEAAAARRVEMLEREVEAWRQKYF